MHSLGPVVRFSPTSTAEQTAGSDSLRALLGRHAVDLVAEHVLAAAPAAYAACPATLAPAARVFVERTHPRGLYRHQAMALEALATGADVCLETPTASGKSLVFQLAARDILERDPSAKILALYPAKALIEDQQNKWTAALAGTGTAAARIHGGVPVGQRKALAATHQVLLVTPDVLHSWAMSQLSDPVVRKILGAVRLVILDEAHVYDGVFGSNAAFLMRRLATAMDASGATGAKRAKLLSATATVGDAAGFLERLTGRRPVVIGSGHDGSARYEKRIVVGKVRGKNTFETKVDVLRSLARGTEGRFLAFVDSRRMVEQVCAVAGRQGAAEIAEVDATTPSAEGAHDEVEDIIAAAAPASHAVMPYRAGYEDRDRVEIQQALAAGRLRGVVSTSALELGIDIGEIDTVVCLGRPPTMKSFWQRIGRAGRRGASTCIILDSQMEAPSSDAELADYLAQPIEPNWLYLDNRYLQFAQALCVARELGDLGRGLDDATDLASLPATFRDYVANELAPHKPVDPDLFPLKQRCAATAPQYAFPLRSAAEEDLAIHLHGKDRLGVLSFAQSLREAYPGGIYMHLARPYRVTGFHQRRGAIEVVRCAYGSTRPILQAMIFPNFNNGIIDALASGTKFVAEVSLQVSERLLGFVEQRGRTREEHLYAPGSHHAQRPIGRFFETTGVCLSFADGHGDDAVDEALAHDILARGCARLGINARDVGCGRFHAATAFGSESEIRGWCIYDTTWGSLRLTSRFLDELPAILEDLRAAADAARDSDVVTRIDRVRRHLEGFHRVANAVQPHVATASERDADASSVVVVAPGSVGMLLDGTMTEELSIEGIVYMPQGLMYRVAIAGARRFVPVALVRPIHGVSRIQRFDPNTYEAEDLGISGSTRDGR